jgi:ABC-type sugar transport system permease subunit
VETNFERVRLDGFIRAGSAAQSRATLGERLRSPDRRLILSIFLVSPLILSVLITGFYPLIYLAAASLTKSTLGRPFIGWVGFSDFVYSLE